MSVEFKIDGKTIIAENGETILQAAARNGIAIPSLCRNQKISHTTSCFVCVVKDCKTGRFLPSCSACPANGQEIESDTAEVFDKILEIKDRISDDHKYQEVFDNHSNEIMEIIEKFHDKNTSLIFR